MYGQSHDESKQGQSVAAANKRWGMGGSIPFPVCKRPFHPFKYVIGEEPERMFGCLNHSLYRHARLLKNPVIGEHWFDFYRWNPQMKSNAKKIKSQKRLRDNHVTESLPCTICETIKPDGSSREHKCNLTDGRSSDTTTFKSCPLGHPLFCSLVSEPDLKCDVCHRPLDLNEHTKSCSRCDFDICRYCYE